jgi:LmbE family N-acetylglucosaminyl deacetylase
MKARELSPDSDGLDPAMLMAGRVLVLAPHQDDEVLGCGGVLASLGDARSVHVAYATDGSASPVPPNGNDQLESQMLRKVRRHEALRALRVLGVPDNNAHFLDLPDSRLAQHGDELARRLNDVVLQVAPERVFVPFRYDQNPDHGALYRAAIDVLGAAPASGAMEIVEYFVYPRMKLLPRGDVRALIERNRLIRFDTAMVSGIKRQALQCYESQTTRYFGWQSRPNLTPELIGQVSAEPEFFLRYDPATAGTRVFESLRYWIPVANWLEPKLKKFKDWLVMSTGTSSVAWSLRRTGEKP